MLEKIYGVYGLKETNPKTDALLFSFFLRWDDVSIGRENKILTVFKHSLLENEVLWFHWRTSSVFLSKQNKKINALVLRDFADQMNAKNYNGM